MKKLSAAPLPREIARTRIAQWSFGLLVAMLIVPTLSAATITWSTPTTISADADVSTAGTLLYAYHFTQSAVATSTINAVPFLAFPVQNGNMLGNVSLTPTQFLDSADTAAGWTTAPFTNLSTNYRSLVAGGTLDFGKLFSLTVGGLTSGQTYRLQIWSNCSSDTGYFFNTPANNSKSLLSAGLSATLDMNSTNTPGGVGQWVIGTFTADGATQTISFSNVGAQDYPVLNAFQLRAVPEPNSSLLLFSGVLLQVASRRQRRASIE